MELSKCDTNTNNTMELFDTYTNNTLELFKCDTDINNTLRSILYVYSFTVRLEKYAPLYTSLMSVPLSLVSSTFRSFFCQMSND